MESQLLLPELAWSLVRLAAVQGSSAPLVERVRGLLQALAAEKHEQASGQAGEGDAAGMVPEASAEADGQSESLLSPVYSDDAEPEEDGSGVEPEASLAGSCSLIDSGSRPATAEEQ
jgi:hypothetical protein